MVKKSLLPYNPAFSICNIDPWSMDCNRMNHQQLIFDELLFSLTSILQKKPMTWFSVAFPDNVRATFAKIYKIFKPLSPPYNGDIHISYFNKWLAYPKFQI